MSEKPSWITRGLELCEKATPGPWMTDNETYYSESICSKGECIAGGDIVANAPDADCPDSLAYWGDNRKFLIDARTNYPRALKLLAEFKPLAEGLIPIAEDVLKLPKLNTEGARLGLEHLKQLLSELEGE